MAEIIEVCVKIIQGRHLKVGANTSTQVVLQVGDKLQSTKTVQYSDSPFFDEHFTFDFKLPLNDVLEKTIKFIVKKRYGYGRGAKSIADFSLLLNNVWLEPGHQIYHQWAPLLHPTDLAAGSQGFLKCDIRILKAGETVPMPKVLDPEEEDYIEGNLILQGECLGLHDRQFAIYKVEVFCADGLPHLPSSVLEKLKGCVGFEANECINPIITVRLAGLEGSTSVQNSRSPTWNESLNFTESFPPIWSCVRVQLHNQSRLGSTLLAEHCIPLSSIARLSRSESPNFPPTFGPSYVHLKTETGKYAGRVLLSISTEILNLDRLESSPKRGIELRKGVLLPKFDETEIGVFAALHEVSMISSELVGRQVQIELSFGSPTIPPSIKHLIPSQLLSGHFHTSAKSYPSLALSNVSPPLEVYLGDGGLGSLDIKEKPPCIFMTSFWPDRRHSMKIYNKLNLMAQKLEAVLELDVTEKAVSLALDQFAIGCIRSLTSLREPGGFGDDANSTKLDKLRATLLRATMEDMHKSAKRMAKENPAVRAKFISESARCLRQLADDPQQGGLPDISIQLLDAEGNILAESTMAVADILYSAKEEETGPLCCIPTNIFLKNNDVRYYKEEAEVMAKLRVFFWLGSVDEASACILNLPPGCEAHQEPDTPFPSSLSFSDKRVFECIAHICQGSFVPGWDKSSLCDPYIRVSIANQTKSTLVKEQTLSPMWNETLVLRPVVVWGMLQTILRYPPLLVIEALDKDFGENSEYVGRTTTVPILQLLGQKKPLSQNLQWFELKQKGSTVASVLAAFELIECISEEDFLPSPIPLRPLLTRYRFECLFWGIRSQNMNKADRPQVCVECAGNEVVSTIISNALTNSNFEKPHNWITLDLPEVTAHLPPLTIKLLNHQNICDPRFQGVCIVMSLAPYLETPTSKAKRTVKTFLTKAEIGPVMEKINLIRVRALAKRSDDSNSDVAPLLSSKKSTFLKDTSPVKRRRSRQSDAGLEIAELDWWSKLHASERISSIKSEEAILLPVQIKLYSGVLEAQPEFGGFTDMVRPFSLVKGHRSEDEDMPEVAVFKGGFNLRKLGTSEDPEKVRMSLLPPPLILPFGSQQGTRVLARLYIVRCLQLRPKDTDGLSDPYIVISTSLGVRMNDRDNYICGELNPVFGRCYELELSLPKEYELIVNVVDHDITDSDDPIGETRIDVEQRLMSRHRARCGISERYNKNGYNVWRDGEEPSHILETLCRQHGLSAPLYRGTQLTVGHLTVQGPPDILGEQLALAMLRRWQEITGWQLVPEHVESRPLFLPRKPGVEQGRLEMWLDLFPEQGPAPGPPVVISPRSPITFEVRVIVWNAEEIPLDDTNIAGEKMSDIFFKCWLGDESEWQATDVHYRSLTGEGQFNWRMVFSVRYLAAERRMVVQRKGGFFSRGERLIPCVLSVQAWDADVISADDFIGSTNLELCRIPLGAKSARRCSLKTVQEGPPINLFIARRTRGWWPLRNGKGGPAGKVELELQVVSEFEAMEHPVGRGRAPPEELPIPKRPDTSFLWFMNPFRAARAVLWGNYGKRLVCWFLFVLVILFILSAIFTLPALIVRKLITKL